MDNQPLVSVLIPTYNCAHFIGEAIESVLAQNYDNLEIIVVDDGSTDNTKAIVERYGKTVNYFYQEHQGISTARNLCLEKSSGEYIAWVDADDYWLPGKLKAQLDYFEKYPDCQVVFTAYHNFIEEGICREDIKVQKECITETIFKCYFPSALIKKELFDTYGRFLNNLIIGEDTEMIYRWRLFAVNIDHFINTTYYCRRLHEKNITFTCNDATVEEMHTIINAAVVEYSAQSGVLVDVINRMKRDMHNKFVAQTIRTNIQKKRNNIINTKNNSDEYKSH